MYLKLSFKTFFGISLLSHMLWFGAGFLLFEQISRLQRIEFLLYILAFSVWIGVISSRFYKPLLLDSTCIRLTTLLTILGPVALAFLLWLEGPPLLSDSNVDLARVEFRQKNAVVLGIVNPSMALYFFLLTHYVLVGKRKRTRLLAALGMLAGTVTVSLTGFRGAAMMPLLYVALLWLAQFYETQTVSKFLFGLVTPRTLVAGVLLASILIFGVVYLSNQRSGDNLSFEQSFDAVITRVVHENTVINFGRYSAELDRAGSQLGWTWIRDLLSVMDVVEDSFQEELSGNGTFTMTSPSWAELKVNFGPLALPAAIFPFFCSTLILLFFTRCVSRLSHWQSDLKKLSQLTINYFLLAQLPNVGHEGFSKVFWWPSHINLSLL